MVTGWPLGRLLEERVDEIKLAKIDVGVANAGQPLAEAANLAEIGDGDLDVDDRLCRQAWH